MKFHAYVAVCLCLPFALLAEGETDATNRVPSEATQSGLDAGFERYKTILDRMPFGRPPPGFDPDAPGGATAGGAAGAAAGEEVPASEEEQQILSSVRISALNVTPAGKVTVGFTDSSVQPPRNYFMEVGEKRGEWTVVEADPDPEKKTVKLSKSGVEATFKLGEGDNPKDGKSPQTAAGRQPALNRSIGGRAATSAIGPKPSGLEIARARRERMREQHEADEKQRRMAAEQARKDREEAQKAAELAAEERKAQREQLTAIQEMLRQQREEKQQAEEERRAAEGQQHDE